MQFFFTRGKRAPEKFPVGVDFANDLVEGDSLVSVAVTAVDSAGTDVTATFINSASLAGSIATAVWQAGVSDQVITAIYKVTSNAGYIYEHTVEVTIE